MKNKKLYSGCGCLLVVVGGLLVLFAVLMGVGSVASDNEAGERNEAEWAEYNAWVAQVDTIEDRAVADSLMETRSAPPIRQGGFASAIGILTGVGLVVVAIIPLCLGWWLIRKGKRIERGVTVLLLLMSLGVQAQSDVKAELARIRQLYAEAQPKTPEQREAAGLPSDLPPDETVVTSHYMAPGNGPVKEELHFYYSCDFDEEHTAPYCQLRFVTRKTSGGSYKNYEEFLFEKGELVFCYLRQTNTARKESTVDETRYYFHKEKGLIHEIIKGGGPVMDDVFARRLASDLKEGFDKLANSPYEY